MSSSLHSNASTHSKRYKLSPASSGRLKHELRWDPPVSDLLHHLRQTATSAFMFGGLLEDLARSPHDELRLWRLAAVYDQDEVVAAAAADVRPTAFACCTARIQTPSERWPNSCAADWRSQDCPANTK